MEGKEFEDQWKKTFEGAEVAPAETVWSGIESDLIVLENQRMKRRVVIYQRLAAASAIFALSLGVLGYYWKNERDFAQFSVAQNEQKSPTKHSQVAGNDERSQNDQKVKDIQVDDQSSKGNIQSMVSSLNRKQKFVVPVTHDRPHSLHQVVTENGESEKAAVVPNVIDVADEGSGKTDSLGAWQNTEPIVAGSLESPLRKKKEEIIHLPGLSEEAEKKEDKKKAKGENMWASLGLSAGTYAPMAGGGSSSQGQSFNTGVAFPSLNGGGTSRGSSTTARTGSSYSAGIALGRRVATHWVVQSGVNYMKQSVGYTSNLVSTGSNAQQALVGDYANVKAFSSAMVTTPYHVNSSLEFISVPLQLGYLLLDRKLGFQMNAGVAADFFIRNSLQATDGQVNGFSQGAGDDSPYRSVNWAGLMSAELSYKLARQYRISLVPGFRYLASPTLKSGSSDHLYVTDIGCRFRYILK